MGKKEGKQLGKDVRRRRGKEAALEEEDDDAAPPTGCWIRLPRLGGGCMSSASKVDSSTSGACGNGGGGKILPPLLNIAFTSLSAFLHSRGSLRPRVRVLDACLYLRLVACVLCVCIHLGARGRVRICVLSSRDDRGLDFLIILQQLCKLG